MRSATDYVKQILVNDEVSSPNEIIELLSSEVGDTFYVQLMVTEWFESGIDQYHMGYLVAMKQTDRNKRIELSQKAETELDAFVKRFLK